MAQVYEGIFLLKYHGNFSLLETMTMPIRLRAWMIERLAKQKTDEAEAAQPKKK